MTAADTVTVPRAVWDALADLVALLDVGRDVHLSSAGDRLDRSLGIRLVCEWTDTAAALRALASAQTPQSLEPVADQRADREPGADALDAGAQALVDDVARRAVIELAMLVAGACGLIGVQTRAPVHRYAKAARELASDLAALSSSR